MPQLRIPKQTDRALILALAAIRDDLKPLRLLTIQVVTAQPGGATVDLPDQQPDAAGAIDFILSEDSEIMPSLSLKDQAGQIALHIVRQHTQITDEVNVSQDAWINQLPQDARARISVKLLSSARKHLKPADAQASLSGGSDSEWTRYRNSQQLILNSLENTLQSLLSEYNRKMLENDAAARARSDQSENELQKRYEAAGKAQEEQHKARMDELSAREQAIKNQEEIIQY